MADIQDRDAVGSAVVVPSGGQDAGAVVHALVALVAGAAALVLLWPTLSWAALLVAPFAVSGGVLIVAVAVAARYQTSG